MLYLLENPSYLGLINVFLLLKVGPLQSGIPGFHCTAGGFDCVFTKHLCFQSTWGAEQIRAQVSSHQLGSNSVFKDTTEYCKVKEQLPIRFVECFHCTHELSVYCPGKVQKGGNRVLKPLGCFTVPFITP